MATRSSTDLPDHCDSINGRPVFSHWAAVFLPPGKAYYLCCINLIFMEKIIGTVIRNDSLKQIGRSRWIVYYGYTEIEDTEYGWSYCHTFEHRPSPEEVRQVIFAQIDADTKEQITQGMRWHGRLVWLSAENQVNYTMWAMNAENNGFMPTIKLGTDEAPVLHTFADITEVHAFIAQMTQHITESIDANRKAKAEADAFIQSLK